MNKPDISQMIQYIQLAQVEDLLHEVIYTEADPENAKHEFLFFIKPEITLADECINLQAILEMLFAKIESYNLRIRDIRILGATYLDKYNIIAQHYGVINALSRKPLEFLSTEALEKFSTVYACSPRQVSLLGSLEFLHRYPDFTPVSLNDLWQKSEGIKLASGTYCAKINMNGEPVFLINGFHPRQLVHFTEKGRSIVAFTLYGDLDWAVARNNFIGKTNPQDAMTGSLRNELIINREAFGLQSVSASNNGFHLSAGPVEGLVELTRYCSDFSNKNLKTIKDFTFGRLLKSNFSEDEINKICDNRFVTNKGQKTSVFDLTEEKNSDIALGLLKESSFLA
jgi:hypothetical protein